MVTTVAQYLTKLVKIIPDIVADELKQAGTMLAVYISDNMLDGSNPTPGKARTDSDPRLYVNGSNLLKAATVPNATGNVSEVRYQNGEIVYELGIDLDVIPYARIHEYGGYAGRGLKSKIPARPYMEPALRAFIAEDDGFGQLIEEIMKRAQREAG